MTLPSLAACRVVVVLSVLPLAACASAQARTPVDKPALEVPPVPPRSVEPPLPPPPETVAPPEPVGNLPKEQPQRSSSKPASREPAREPAKPPESKPDPATPPAAEAAPQPAPAVPPLRTPEAPPSADAASRAVRDIIERVRKTLDSVNFQNLKPELQREYNNAKLFLQQAEDAVSKANNYELGRSLVDKAERIAKQLQGR